MTVRKVTVSEALKSHLLAPCVLRQLGGGADAVSSAIDAANHGADSGFVGFSLTCDCVQFFTRNRIAIIAAVEAMADDLGENPAEMVAGFNCLAGRTLRHIGDSSSAGRGSGLARQQAIREYLPAASRCIYGGKLTDDDDTVANALAWFALEEVGRAIVDLSERY